MFTDPLTPLEIEERILQCIDDLSVATDEFRELARAAGLAEVRHKSMRAAALRASEAKTVGDREADADRATSLEFEARRNVESAAAVHKESLYSLRAILNAYQSLLSMMRGQV